jgi:hypothetical protein
MSDGDAMDQRARSMSVLLVSDRGTVLDNGGVMFQLRTPLKPRSVVNSMQPAYMAVASAVFPMNYTPITNNNNTVSISSPNGAIIIELRQDLHYDGDSLASSLQTLMNAADPGLGAIVLYNRSTFKLMFSSSLLGFTIISTSSSARLVLGLGDETIVVVRDLFISPKGSIDLAGPRYLLVGTDLPSRDSDVAHVTLGGIVAVVPITASPGQVLIYSPAQLDFTSTTIDYLTSLTVFITDERGDTVDFGGLSWSIQFLIDLGRH